jgi:hypothetical protein
LISNSQDSFDHSITITTDAVIIISISISAKPRTKYGSHLFAIRYLPFASLES